MRYARTVMAFPLLFSGLLTPDGVRAGDPLSYISVQTRSWQQIELTQWHSATFAIRWLLHDRRTSGRETTESAHILAELSRRATASLLDYHPFGTGFRLTTGFYYHDHNFDVSGYPLRADPRLSGGARATIRYFDVSPYLGLGWGGRWGGGGNLRYSLDLGVIDQGPPEVSVDLPSVAGITPGRLRTIEVQAVEQLRHKLSENRLAPVLSFSLNWTF